MALIPRAAKAIKKTPGEDVEFLLNTPGYCNYIDISTILAYSDILFSATKVPVSKFKSVIYLNSSNSN